ncbi:hypothetical protein GCM10010528_00660 [Gordonia defluvii]|uniref:4Fe-4S Wbl-type domain-containing protein n=1 Tax=Gordonia defluvii TaxID=283718 RepID=A0ABP6KWZ6_9ACTN
MTRRPGAGDGWPALVAQTIEGSPKLDGARCAELPGSFDARDVGESRSSVEERHRLAVGLCHACPALAACRAHYGPDPDPRLGVVAGIAPATRHQRRTNEEITNRTQEKIA